MSSRHALGWTGMAVLALMALSCGSPKDPVQAVLDGVERASRELELELQRRRARSNLVEEGRVALGRREFEQFAEVARRRGELLPERQLLSEPFSLPSEASSGALVVPESGGEHLRLDRGEARRLPRGVKAPPTWPRFDREDRGVRRRRRSPEALTRSPEGDDGVLLLHVRDRSRGYAP